MARIQTYQAGFEGGILTPKLLGRFDIERFRSSVLDANNMLILPHGGATRRPGTRFVAEAGAASPTDNVRLVPFRDQDNNNYVLEFGPFYVRVFRDEVPLTFVQPASGDIVTNGDFATDLSGWTDSSTGTASVTHDALLSGRAFFDAPNQNSFAILEQDITIDPADANKTLKLNFAVTLVAGRKTRGLTARVFDRDSGDLIADLLKARTGVHQLQFEPNGRTNLRIEFETRGFSKTTIQGTTDIPTELFLDTVEIPIVGTSSDPAQELVTPYSSDDLLDLSWAQSNDVLFLANPNHPPQEFIRHDVDVFSFQEHDFLDGPYEPINTDDVSVSTAANGDSNLYVLDASDAIFSPGDVGRTFRHRDDDNEWRWGVLQSFISTTEMEFLRRSPIPSPASSFTNPTNEWRFGSWFDPDSWPRLVTFFRNRLVWASSRRQPSTVWMSTVDAFNSHEPSDPDGTVVADSGINIALLDDAQNDLAWIKSTQEGLLVGSVSGEHIIRRPTTTAALSPTNVESVLQSQRGSLENVQPTQIGRSLIFLQRDGRTLREAVFDFEVNGFTERDVTLLADSLFVPGIRRLEYQQAPLSIMWVALEDGTLALMTFESDQRVLAWSRAVLAGTDADVRDLTVISDGDRDQVWLLVRRTVNGVTRLYLETVDPLFDPSDGPEEAYFLDSGLSGTFDPEVTQIFGLDHLIGEAVGVIADGATHPDVVVASDGSITLERSASRVHAGLRYVSGLSLLPVDLTNSSTVSVGRGGTFALVKRIVDFQILLESSSDLLYGRDTASLRLLSFREAGTPMNSPTPLFSGRRDVNLNGVSLEETTFVLQTNDALPLQVLAVNLRVDASGAA